MADNKNLEMVAENLIAHFLQRHGILMAKPCFDQDGGDLIAMTNDSGVRFCRIQSKGRTVLPGKGSNVLVKHEYVRPSFILCLYIEDNSFDQLNLFVFFHEQIQQWPTTKDGHFKLELNQESWISDLEPFKIKKETVQRIANDIMDVELPTSKVYRYEGTGGIGAGGTGLMG